MGWVPLTMPVELEGRARPFFRDFFAIPSVEHG